MHTHMEMLTLWAVLQNDGWLERFNADLAKLNPEGEDLKIAFGPLRNTDFTHDDHCYLMSIINSHPGDLEKIREQAIDHQIEKLYDFLVTWDVVSLRAIDDASITLESLYEESLTRVYHQRLVGLFSDTLLLTSPDDTKYLEDVERGMSILRKAIT
jgi:hypothetical protein